MSDVVTLAAVGASAVGTVGVFAVMSGAKSTRVAQVWRFPPDLAAAQIEALLGVVAGLSSGSLVTFAVHAEPHGLAFTATATRSTLRLLEGALRGIAPGIRLESAAAPSPPAADTVIRRVVRWSGSHPLLRTEAPDLASAALLGVMLDLYRGERVSVRVHLRPAGRVRPPMAERAGQQQDVLARWLGQQRLARDVERLVRAKYAAPLLRMVIEVEITAAASGRARVHLRRIVAMLRSRTGARGRLTVRRRRGDGSRVPRPTVVVNAAEVAGLLGMPIAGVVVPGLEYSRAPRLMPSVRIPGNGAGRRFASSTWPGMADRQLVQPVRGSLSHSLIVGPTGTGKSALLTGLMLQDVAAGRGALLLDMKGDTVTDLLQRIPTGREKDVVLLDPTAGVPLPGIKGLGSGDPELTADLWLGIFRGLFADSWGVRTERYLRLGLLTITRDPSATITDLPRVFSDQPYRRRLVAVADDPLLAAAWVRFDALSAAQAAEHVQAPLGKVQDVISRKVVRGIVGQRNPRLTIREAIRSNKLVLVRLAPGQIGEPAARLLGGLMVYETYQAVLERQGWTPEARTPFGFYIDEPAVLDSLPVPLDSLFELARGLGVGVTMAAQSVSQLPALVRRSALTNVSTIASFRAGADDAALLARELPGMTAEQLQYLERFEIALRLGLDHGDQAPVVTGKTAPPPEPCSNPAKIARLSGQRYGRPMADVDAELRQRQSGQRSSTTADAASGAKPVGRRRRSS